MVPRPGSLRDAVEEGLWPLVEDLLGWREVAGLAVAVVRDDEVVSRGFGVRSVHSGAPVTTETMFHLASVSKPFVATAVVGLSMPRDGRPVLDLDAPVVDWVPELTLADGRVGEVTARHLLSHSSGLPDVTDYGWHDPQLGDDALSDFARSMSGWRLQAEPGSTFSYSNAGFELLGLLLSRVTGLTFEEAVRQQVLAPLGMRRSTFLHGDVPVDLASAPHVGMPLTVPDGAYPYSRRHSPSSTLHSNLDEMCRWIRAHLEPADVLGRGLLDRMWQPVVTVGEPPWDEAATLGWGLGRYRGHRTLSHSGTDPGFVSRLVLVPERRTGVVVLANSNTVPATTLAAAALDLTLPDASSDDVPDKGVMALRAMRPSVVAPVAETLAAAGPDAATALFQRLAAEPARFDDDDEVFVDAVWGAIELHRPALVWPLLRLWTGLRPTSSAAWAMTGWAHQVEGDVEGARTLLRRALDLDPGNDEAAMLLGTLPDR